MKAVHEDVKDVANALKLSSKKEQDKAFAELRTRGDRIHNAWCQRNAQGVLLPDRCGKLAHHKLKSYTRCHRCNKMIVRGSWRSHKENCHGEGEKVALKINDKLNDR
jgi:hypothetical protein